MTDGSRQALSGLLALAAGGLAIAGFLAAQPSTPPAPKRPAGPAAIDFTLPRLQGGEVRLSALRGKVVLVDFWATWCGPCRAELPWLVPLAKRFESKGVALVAISEDDPPGQVPLVTQFAKQVPGLADVAVLGDPDIESRYGVDSLPTLFIVDREGTIVSRLVGGREEAEVTALLERVTAR